MKGKSAYQDWVDAGHQGSVDDYLLYLKGDKGDSAYDIWLQTGHTGSFTDFLNSLKGDKGDSAYEVWKDNGHEDESVNDFLASIKGDKGDTGETGDSAYETWIKLGNTGSEDDFIDSLKWKSVYSSWAKERQEQGLDSSIEAFTKTMATFEWGEI